MFKFISYSMILFMLISGFGCSSINSPSPENSASSELKQIPGLQVNGSRTRANVIANMEPIIAEMQKIYEEHRLRNPELKGRMDLRLTVEWIGEILEIEILNSTITDKIFLREVLAPVQFNDFDGWGESDDTEVICPLLFGE